jgi:hypothetical protein
MGPDDFDTVRDVLAGVIDVQRHLIASLPDSSAQELGPTLDALDDQLRSVRRGENKRVVALTLEQLTLAEPDGTVRLIATCAHREPRQRGGLLFYSEEGRECGGFVYSAQEHGEHPRAGALLAMDQYRQDQILGLSYSDWDGRRVAGFHIFERPDVELEHLMSRLQTIEEREDGPARDAARDELLREGKMGSYWPTRLFLGRNDANDATLDLHDLEGRTRL